MISILDEALNDPDSNGSDVVEMTVSLIEVRKNQVFLTYFKILTNMILNTLSHIKVIYGILFQTKQYILITRTS